MSVTGWDGVTLTVEIALSAATSTYGLWDAAIWDTSTWGPDVVWTDVTTYVRLVRTGRGFSRGLQAWSQGQATVVLSNTDGRFDPSNLSGPYVSGGVTQVRPLRPVRITAVYAGVTYYLYRGYVMDWAQSWSVAPTNSGDAVTTLTCADEFVRLTAVDGYAVTPVGVGELSGTRVHRVLDAAGFTGDRNVAVGVATLQATDLADNTLSELEDVVDAEGGALYVDSDGSLVFSSQYALIEDSRSVTSQATFGDSSTDIRYADADMAYDSDLVVNWAAYNAVGGTVQSAYDSTSRALYGDRRDTKTGLICVTDAQALSLAQWKVQQYKDPELRFTKITLTPRRDPTVMWPQTLGRKVRDQITVNRHPPGGHTVSQACHIAGVSHDITPANWITDFQLWSATPYVAYAASRWDVGLWDSALWFF